MTEPTPPPDEPAPAPKTVTWKRALLFVVELLVIAGIGWALVRRRADLAAALDLSVLDIVLVFALCAAAAPLRAVELSTVVRTLGVKMSFLESLSLTQAATLLNYLPMQAGTLLRARVLKQQRAVSYARYVSIMSCLVLFGMTAGSVEGLAMLSRAHGLSSDARTAAALVFGAVVLATAVFVVAPLERLPFGSGWIGRRAHDLVSGWKLITTDRRALATLFVIALSNPLLLGARYLVCFSALSLEVTAPDALLLASAILVSIPVNITPGGVGTRELIGTAIGVAAGLEFSQVLFAVTIDRVVSLTFSAVAGSSGLVWLKRRGLLAP